MNKKTGLFILFVFLMGRAWALDATSDERALKEWCDAQKGKYGVFVTDDMRCDCLTGEYAIDMEIADKWPEAIGRGLANAHYSGKAAGIGLVFRNEKDRKLIARAEKMLTHLNLPVRIWEIRLQLPAEDQKEWDAEFESANEAFAKGKYSKAIGILKEILQKDPASEKAWLILGQSYYGNKQPLEAVDCYKKVLEINPDTAQAIFFMGMAYEYAGWTSEAYEQYKILKPINTRLADELYRMILH